MLIGRGQWGAACAGALFYFLSSASARAQSAAPVEESPRALGYATRPFHLEFLSGIATPVGVLGVRAEGNIGDLLALGAGIGANGFGPEWEAHARVRILHGVHRHKLYSALTLEGAFARGKYGGFNFDPEFDECDRLNPHDGCYEPPVVPQTVNWGQVELGWEAMFPSGFTLRLASGWARQIGSYHWQCTVLGAPAPCGADSLPSESLFVFSFALGYAF